MERWSSSIGFLLAAIGSAVGIGNIWRFPAVLGQNGGGAYLIPYLIAVFLFAMPLVLLEITMGRNFRSAIVSAFRSVRPEFRFIGWLLVGIVFIILSYYLVITGWTLGYFCLAGTGHTVSFGTFTATWLPILFFTCATLATGLIVSQGIQKGIEKISLVLLPVSVIILGIMAVYGIFLPGFWDGIRYLFTPDFSVLGNPLIWSAAFGQAFFSLSVGEGILLTYGMYLERDQNVAQSTWIITVADLGVAILAGFVIFPIVFTYGLAPEIGAELAFTSLPLGFARMPVGQLISAAFFIALFFAALTSTISMLEVSVAALRESLGWSRIRVTAVLTGGLLVAGLPAALSYSTVHLTFGGIRVLDFLDETVGTVGLPIGALLISLVFSWFVPEEVFREASGLSPGITRFLIPLYRYGIPLVLALTTAGRIAAGFDFPGTRLLPGSSYIGQILQAEGILAIVVIVTAAAVIICRIRTCRVVTRLNDTLTKRR